LPVRIAAPILEYIATQGTRVRWYLGSPMNTKYRRVKYEHTSKPIAYDVLPRRSTTGRANTKSRIITR
jgi:hypothetical protein